MIFVTILEEYGNLNCYVLYKTLLVFDSFKPLSLMVISLPFSTS